MSSPDVARTPLQATARRWPLAVALVVLGTAAGAGVASAVPTTYTAEARMAVGGTDIKAQAVPGFALASSEIAANYARFVAVGPIRQTLSPAEQTRLKTVTASPLPDSNVIRIEATASDETTAVTAASAASTALKAQVAQAVSGETPQAALAAFSQIAQQVATAQQQQGVLEARVSSLRASLPEDATTSPALSRATTQLASLSAQVQTLQTQQNALGVKYQNLVNAPASQSQIDIVLPAAPSFDDYRSKLQRYGLAGLVLGLLAAIVLATLLERRAVSRRRRPTAAEPVREPAALQPLPTDQPRATGTRSR